MGRKAQQLSTKNAQEWIFLLQTCSLYSDALKDSRRSIEEIVPFKLLWKDRKDPINSFH